MKRCTLYASGLEYIHGYNKNEAIFVNYERQG